MVTTSYPRFPGDSVGTFMEPIAASVAARGHEVHVVAPWHPLVARAPEERGVRFHFYKYAPFRALNVFGYAAALRADVTLRGAALVAAPLALAAGWFAALRVARRYRATVMHGHWVVPGGFTAWAAAPARPQVVSLHGSDVYVAETFAPARRAARLVFDRAGAVTACSADLAQRAIGLGADPATHRSRAVRRRHGPIPPAARATRVAARATGRGGGHAARRSRPGRLVRKKGFEHLIDAWARPRGEPAALLAIAGDGDLRDELRDRARAGRRRPIECDFSAICLRTTSAAPRGRRYRGHSVGQGRQRERGRPAEHRARGAGRGPGGDRHGGRRHRHRRRTRANRARGA